MDLIVMKSKIQHDGPDAVKERSESMSWSIVAMIGVVVLWVVLNRWVLPKMGIST